MKSKTHITTQNSAITGSPSSTRVPQVMNPSLVVQKAQSKRNPGDLLLPPICFPRPPVPLQTGRPTQKHHRARGGLASEAEEVGLLPLQLVSARSTVRHGERFVARFLNYLPCVGRLRSSSTHDTLEGIHGRTFTQLMPSLGGRGGSAHMAQRWH